MEKEAHFTEKKVDQSWKEEVAREKGAPEPPAETGDSPLSFSHFITSLGFQTLLQLGEIPHPETKQAQVDLGAAKETIDLLVLLQSKTQGNLTAQEEKLLKDLLAELQIKFVEKVSHS